MKKTEYSHLHSRSTPKKAFQYYVMSQTLAFLLTNVVLYWRIIVAVAIQEKKKFADNKKNDRITKVIIIVLTAMLCWLPGNFLTFIKVPNPFKRPNGFRAFSVVYSVMMVAVSVPAFANAFIYAGQHREYRKAYAMLFACKSPASIHP